MYSPEALQIAAKIQSRLDIARQNEAAPLNPVRERFFRGQVSSLESALRDVLPPAKLQQSDGEIFQVHQKERIIRQSRRDMPVGHKFENCTIIAEYRFDDTCKNKHNTLSITGKVFSDRKEADMCGMMHDVLVDAFPDLSDAIRFHLCSTDGPMYYIENTIFHVQNGNLDSARKSALWPDATDEELKLEGLDIRLLLRLPKVLEEFKQVILSLGFNLFIAADAPTQP